MGLFERRISIATDFGISDRDWKGLKKHLGSKRRQMLFEAYLSGCSGKDNQLASKNCGPQMRYL
jgi:hypothetical protein